MDAPKEEQTQKSPYIAPTVDIEEARLKAHIELEQHPEHAHEIVDALFDTLQVSLQALAENRRDVANLSLALLGLDATVDSLSETVKVLPAHTTNKQNSQGRGFFKRIFRKQ